MKKIFLSYIMLVVSCNLAAMESNAGIQHKNIHENLIRYTTICCIHAVRTPYQEVKEGATACLAAMQLCKDKINRAASSLPYCFPCRYFDEKE